MFNFFKRDRKNKVETLPNIEIDNCVMTDTLSDSEDNLLTAKQARELRDKTGSNFKEKLFEDLRFFFARGYSEHRVYSWSRRIDILTYEYCVGVGKTELEELGYTVVIEGNSVTISW